MNPYILCQYIWVCCLQVQPPRIRNVTAHRSSDLLSICSRSSYTASYFILAVCLWLSHFLLPHNILFPCRCHSLTSYKVLHDVTGPGVTKTNYDQQPPRGATRGETVTNRLQVRQEVCACLFVCLWTGRWSWYVHMPLVIIGNQEVNRKWEEPSAASTWCSSDRCPLEPSPTEDWESERDGGREIKR